MAKQKPQDDFMPTPPIGFRVLWRERGGKNILPADVLETNIGEPGIVTLTVHYGNGSRRIESVHWENHPGAANVGTPGVQFRGTWAYMEDQTTVPDGHYKLHMDTLTARDDAKKAQEEWVKEQERIAKSAAEVKIDPIAVEVARMQAAQILNG